MLGHSASSSSQYIRPDYLPSTLDAQKSPLAMLAATCNSIGAPDLPKNIKNVELPPASKKSSPLSTGGSENKRPRKSPDSSEKLVDRKSDKHHHAASKTEEFNSKEKDPEREKDRKEKQQPVEEKSEKPAPAAVTDRTDRKSSKSPSVKSSPTPPKSGSVLSAPLNPNPMSGTPFSSLSSTMNDPLNFASRMKAPLQLPGMVPYCRDPFCYGCTSNMHCGTNPTVPMDYSALSSYSSLANGLSSNKNLVCSWVNGDSYCGKRFLTSEELFGHLRTHTNLTVSGLSSDPLQNAAYASYASYLSRFPTLGLNPARYNPYKTPVPSVTTPLTGYPNMWPNGPTPGFFSPPSYFNYRPPF